MRAGTHPMHTPRRGRGAAAGSLLGGPLPPPLQTLLPYLPEGGGSASKLLPITAPSTPLGSLWGENRKEELWARPPHPNLLSLAALGCGAGGKQPVSLKVPYSEGESFGDALQISPASLEVPEAPARPQPGLAQPSGFSPASPWPSRFSRMDPVGESSAPEHSQGAEQEERGAHGSAAPSPPRQSPQKQARAAPPALPNRRCVS